MKKLPNGMEVIFDDRFSEYNVANRRLLILSFHWDYIEGVGGYAGGFIIDGDEWEYLFSTE